jgi:hypothetical protein
MPSIPSASDFISQVRALVRLSFRFPTPDWCATVNSECPAISDTDRLRYDRFCHRSNGIRSKVTDFASGRTFDPNPACTDSFLGRMFFDGIHCYTTTTVVGSVRVMDCCVSEATSQLVSPRIMFGVDGLVDNRYTYAPARNDVQHIDNEPPLLSTRSIQESPAQSFQLLNIQINGLPCYSHSKNLSNLPFRCQKSLRYSIFKIRSQVYHTDYYSLPLPTQHLQWIGTIFKHSELEWHRPSQPSTTPCHLHTIFWSQRSPFQCVTATRPWPEYASQSPSRPTDAL